MPGVTEGRVLEQVEAIKGLLGEIERAMRYEAPGHWDRATNPAKDIVAIARAMVDIIDRRRKR